MTNINKYWIILESLSFPIVGGCKDNISCDEERRKINLEELKKCIKLNPQQIIKSIINDQPHFQYLESRQQELIESLDERFLYGLYLVEVVLNICKNVNFTSNAKEDLISENQKCLIISSLKDVAEIVLQGNLHNTFYINEGKVFKKYFESGTKFCQLEFFTEIFSKFLHIKQLQIGKLLDDVQLWYMAAIFSLLLANDSKEYKFEVAAIVNLQAKLQKLWLELPKRLYYRNLMMLYSILPNAQKHRIHKEMLLRLWSKGGFMALLFAMKDSQRSEEQSIDEMIANIVAQPSYSIKAQHSLAQQIIHFVKASLKNKELSTFMGSGLLSLRKLYDNKQENKIYLKEWLKNEMQPLLQVDEAKLIAMEWCEFVELMSLLFHIFCTSAIATLPSDLLLPYLPVFIELYSQIERHFNQESVKNHLKCLILQVANNRSKNELSQLIDCIVLKKYPKEWFLLYYTIQMKENPLNMQELKLSLMEVGVDNILMENSNHLGCLIKILKSSSYNLLLYQLFIILLQKVPSLMKDFTSHSSNGELLASEDEVYNKILSNISRDYEHKFSIISSLEVLVQHPPLKSIINDNIQELLKVLQNILSAVNCPTDTNETVLLILIALIREIVENCSVETYELRGILLKPLKQLLTQVKSKNLENQIKFLIKVIEGDESFSYNHIILTKSNFEDARKLIESHESYLQVEGIEKMIKLVNKCDEFTITNCHVLTVLALNTLKSIESYTFLNCVRLFVALVNVNESEVLELLSDEYLNDSAKMDYRLVVGEAILKTCRELGPLCYKYKNVLLNTYMAGCRSPLDEFRLSAFSNLSQMCRLLTYQVHNYFQELLNIIDCEITTGKYQPAKRAAVMVLSDILAGMDNLFDYEEMLLPIYRLLKYLAASETTDEKMHIHISNGLKILNDKCKHLFKSALQNDSLEKEIKVIGIHEKPTKSRKAHILEIN